MERYARVINRRRLLGRTFAFLGVSSAGAILCACDPQTRRETAPVPGVTSDSEGIIDIEGAQKPQEGKASFPTARAAVQIEGVGSFHFDAGAVMTTRPDIFQPGHFSLFDVLVHLNEAGDIGLDYRFDETMGTHVIDTINGIGGWWYDAYYAGGWSERSTFRTDHYPYKGGTTLRLRREREELIQGIYQTYREEISRLAANDGVVVVPDVHIDGPRERWSFSSVTVTAHDVRRDILVPGVVTALDVLLSLQDQGDLSDIRLTWYDRIGSANPVETYFVEQINDAVAAGGCGFVYEVGPAVYKGFRGNHNHVPSDVRVILAPEYGHWFWICL